MTAPRSTIVLTALLTAVPLLVAAGAQPAAAELPGTAAATTNGMIATFAWKPGAHISSPLDLVVMNADGSGAQVLVPAAATRSLCGFDLDWSPDGNRIAWASQSEVWAVDADGTDRTLLANGCVSHFQWAPGGATLAVEIDSRTGLLTVATGAFEWLRPCAYGELGATFSPDGTRMTVVATADCDQDPIGWGIYGFDVADGSLDARYADTNLPQPAARHARLPSRRASEWHPDPGHGAHLHGRRLRRRQLPPPRPDRAAGPTPDLYTVAATSDAPLVKVGSTSGEYELSERDGQLVTRRHPHPLLRRPQRLLPDLELRPLGHRALDHERQRHLSHEDLDAVEPRARLLQVELAAVHRRDHDVHARPSPRRRR